MEKTNTSLRIPKDLVKKMHYFQRVTGMSQTDFVTAAIKEKIEALATVRSGGIVVHIPNPDMNRYTDQERGLVMAAINDASRQIMKVSPSIDFGLCELVTFGHSRLFTDSEKTRQKFMENMAQDAAYIVDESTSHK